MKLFLLTNLFFMFLFSCSSAGQSTAAGDRVERSGNDEYVSDYDDEADSSSKEGDSSRRSRSLETKCKEGDPESCYDLGTSYFQGNKNEKDYKKAGKYFYEACKLDHARGCYVLGMMFNNAVGTKRNCKKADDFFMRGCELDDENACVYLWECDESKEKGRFFFSEDEKDEDYDRSDNSDEFSDYSDW